MNRLGGAARAQITAAFGQAETAVKSTATVMDKAAESMRQTGAAMQTAGAAGVGALTKFAINAGEAREAIVLLHEAITGRFSRIPGSLLVLAERFNVFCASIA